MAKLEGFSRVAVVNFSGYTDYHFAIYDDGVDYQVGDMVAFSNGSTPQRIKEVISVGEANTRFSKNITAEVIGKVDTTAYDKRVEQRREKEKLKKNLISVRKKFRKS